MADALADPRPIQAAYDLDASFRPLRWLGNRHAQSVLPDLPIRRWWLGRRLRPVLAASRPLLVDCGEGVRLRAFHSSHAHGGGTAGGRVALLVHGWEGSASSVYVLSLAELLYARGFEVVRLNLRDHGRTHHLNRELFHSCRLAEVVGAARQLQARFGGRPLHLAGFSLGGNFVLRVAALAREAGLAVAQAVAVSPVLDPAATLEALESGVGAYHRYFMHKWKRSLSLKEAAWPGDYDFSTLRKITSLRRMTVELVRRYTEFSSLEEYLDGYALVGPRLARLEVPATIITALDDPIIPARSLERLAPSAALRVVATRRGGHCGFLDRALAWTWAERRAAAELDAGAAGRR
ncbi:MAG: YheT family hydrolase [Steroidobacteraceae bacterium]